MVRETNIDETIESFHLALGDVTGKSNSAAVLSIGANAKTWSNRINWIQDQLPLGLQIVHEKKDRHKTPLVRRIHYHQKFITKKLRSGRRKDPNFLTQVFFVPVLDGELLNQSVGFWSEAMSD